jgi:hypothetical protein
MSHVSCHRLTSRATVACNRFIVGRIDGATAFDLQPAVAAIEALCDLGGGAAPTRRTRPFRIDQASASARSTSRMASWRLDQCKASTDQGRRPLGVNRVGLATSESLRFSSNSGSIAEIAALRICARTDVPPQLKRGTSADKDAFD